MSKFSKGILITAVICLVLGISIVTVVGVTSGFSFIKNGFSFGWFPKTFETEDIETISFGDDITNLLIDIEVCDVEVKIGDGFTVSGENLIKDTVTIEEINGKLSVCQHWNNRFVNIKMPEQKLVVTVPEGFYAEYVDMNFGVGNVIINGLDVKNGHYEFGVGEVIMTRCSADKIKIKSGVGEIDIKDSSFNDATLETGVGEVSFDGKMTGKCSISTGVGEMRLGLNGNYNDYYFNVDAGVGGVTMDCSSSESGSGVIKNRSGSFGKSEASNHLDIDSGVGEVYIEIND